MNLCSFDIYKAELLQNRVLHVLFKLYITVDKN